MTIWIFTFIGECLYWLWFVYCRGDTPFCSEECRQQEIEKDEAKDRKRNISSLKAMRKKEQKQQSTSPNKTSAEDYPLRPGTVAAAWAKNEKWIYLDEEKIIIQEGLF